MRRLGVVLVHGFRSGPGAWDPLRALIAADEDLAFADTLPFAYATGWKRLHPLRVLPGIDTAADSLKEYLATEAGDFEELVLVTHSQGGLVAQRMLARMLGDGRGRELARIRAVVMLACPNNGSELFLSLRRGLFGSRHPQESQLRPLNEQVTRTLRTVLRDVVGATAVTERTCPIPFSVYAGESDAVVPPASAQSVFPDAAALPGDHSGILRATTADHRTFTTLRRHILRAHGSSGPPPVPSSGEPSAPPEHPLPTAGPAATSATGAGTKGAATTGSTARVLAGLPARSRTFTGREEDVRALLALLAPGGGAPGTSPVRAVVGMAGVGKTELVLQAAECALREPGWFPGGFLFADLAGHDPEPARRATASDVLGDFLRTLDVPAGDVPSGTDARAALLRTTLAARAGRGLRTLVLIDNAGSEEQVRPLLPGDPDTAALVTSRTKLAIGGRPHDLKVLDAAASVDFLDEALRYAGPDDTRIEDAPAAALSIAELCAGLPLALHIVAALLVDFPTRPPADLSRALQAEHTRLDRLARDDRAVRAAFDLSYRRLTDGQARLFRLLPVNPGPDLSTEAAARLGALDEDTAAGVLEDLARAHLIEPSRSWGRWRLHDLLRLYAGEVGAREADADERDSVRRRLFDHYWTLALTAVTLLRPDPDGPLTQRFDTPREAQAWLEDERHNLTPAATSPGSFGPADLTLVLGLNLGQWFERRRHFDDWSAVAASALSTARSTGQRRSEARALDQLGNCRRLTRRFPEAITHHREAVAVFRSLDDPRGEGGALSSLGVALRRVHRFDEAIEAFSRAARLAQEQGDEQLLGRVLGNLGITLRQVGRYEEAIETLRESVALHRKWGERREEGQGLCNLANALAQTGGHAEAVRLAREAVAIFTGGDDRHGRAGALSVLGTVLSAAGHFDDAVAPLREAAESFEDLDDAHARAIALANLGVALAGAGTPASAVAPLTEAVAALRQLDDVASEATARRALEAAARSGRAEPEGTGPTV
ncbi:tetratricopeptide repeat protein [Streptomyces sp. NPDC051555]|uniref:tetratricopeptide repeat protein n=1 Tax=Streptomyces sp. NPDC051555 TaxID=3365657 RepID=UPI0037992FEC